MTETKTSDQWNGDIDLATTAIFLGNGYATADGTWSGTITLTYDDMSGGGPGYAGWSSGAPFNEDKNGDGVENGLAFLLGAQDPDADALGFLPTVTEVAGGLVLNFQMLDAAARGDASLELEYSTTLAAGSWTGLAVPDASNTVLNTSSPMPSRPTGSGSAATAMARPPRSWSMNNRRAFSQRYFHHLRFRKSHSTLIP